MGGSIDRCRMDGRRVEWNGMVLYRKCGSKDVVMDGDGDDESDSDHCVYLFHRAWWVVTTVIYSLSVGWVSIHPGGCRFVAY